LEGLVSYKLVNYKKRVLITLFQGYA